MKTITLLLILITTPLNALSGSWVRSEFYFSTSSQYYKNCKTRFAVIETFNNGKLEFAEADCQQDARTVKVYKYYMKQGVLFIGGVPYKLMYKGQANMILMNQHRQLIHYIRVIRKKKKVGFKI